MILVRPSVELITVTPDADAVIERATRICYRSEERGLEARRKLLHSCLMRGHHTVFEHASATVEWMTSRSVTHQLVRHRIASYCQESQRYCKYGDGNLRFIVGDYDTLTMEHLKNVEEEYNRLLSKGMKPERARDVLPNCTATTIIITANFREWMHVFSLRCSDHAEEPIRELATLTLEKLKAVSEVFQMWENQNEDA